MDLYPRKPRYYNRKEREIQRRTDQAAGYRTALGFCLGHLAHAVGPSQAGQQVGVSKRVAQYWSRKASDPQFHPLPWGGRRDENMHFGSIDGDVAAQVVVLAALDAEPKISFQGLLQKVRSVPGMENVSPWWLSTTIKGWHFSWRKMARFARLKFTEENKARYIDYCVNVSGYPLEEVWNDFEVSCVLRSLIACTWFAAAIYR